MTGYRVDTAALADADVLLGETAAAARAALQVVRAAAGELLGSRWAGPAATGFRIGWAEWSAGMSALLDGLDAMAGALGSSGAEYAAIDAQVRTAVGQAAT